MTMMMMMTNTTTTMMSRVMTLGENDDGGDVDDLCDCQGETLDGIFFIKLKIEMHLVKILKSKK